MRPVPCWDEYSCQGVDSDHLAACQLREHGCQTMKIILRPLVERMIMAVGTLHPTSHENFADKLCLLPRVLDKGEEGSGPYSAESL